MMNAPQLHEAQNCMFATAATHPTHIIALLAHPQCDSVLKAIIA